VNLGRSIYKDASALILSAKAIRHRDKAMNHDTRLTLTIPFPSYIPRGRGIHAVGKFGSLLKAKCSIGEFEEVDKAASKIGVSRSEFIRWCAVKTAAEVMKDVPDA
jgi:hypothetical protein